MKLPDDLLTAMLLEILCATCSSIATVQLLGDWGKEDVTKGEDAETNAFASNFCSSFFVVKNWFLLEYLEFLLPVT